MASLNSINLTADLKPRKDGLCQWGAIEAAKVLLDDKYKPVSLSDIPSSYNTDPIEDHLGRGQETRVPCTSCNEFSEFKDALTKLKNGEFYIINGESFDLTHAYIILKVEHRFFIIDADRGVYKEVRLNSPRDFIIPIKGWEVHPGTELDYSQLTFVNKNDEAKHTEKDDEYGSSFSMYKITPANLSLFKSIEIIGALSLFAFA